MRRDSGVALLTAIGFLFIFSMLGMAYIGYAMTIFDGAQYDTRQIRVRNMAEGGVQAAIGALQKDLAEGRASGATTKYEFVNDFYQLDRSAAEKMSASTDRRWVTNVAVTDESGKLNLNFAPTRVLQAVLGIDGDTARKIRSALPVQEPGAAPSADAASRHWLLSLDDLVSRGILSPAAYTALPKNLVTVHSVVDPANPVEFLNVNVAPPEVLAAVLDVTVEAANQAIQKRPFASPAALVAAVGKGADSFNMKPAPDAPGALPRELSLRSKCFRIESTAGLMLKKIDGSEERVAQSYAEAVVVLDDDGSAKITFWREAPQRDDAGKA